MWKSMQSLKRRKELCFKDHISHCRMTIGPLVLAISSLRCLLSFWCWPFILLAPDNSCVITWVLSVLLIHQALQSVWCITWCYFLHPHSCSDQHREESQSSDITTNFKIKYVSIVVHNNALIVSVNTVQQTFKYTFSSKLYICSVVCFPHLESCLPNYVY